MVKPISRHDAEVCIKGLDIRDQKEQEAIRNLARTRLADYVYGIPTLTPLKAFIGVVLLGGALLWVFDILWKLWTHA